MNTDGNLILFFWNASPSVLWQTGTSGHSGAYLYEQGWDGNLVLYDSGGHAYWATNQYSANSTLTLQNDANLVVYTSGGSVLWATYTVNSYLTGSQTLYSGQYLQAPNRLHQLIMQSDGNLVLYYTWPGNQTGPLWASGTNGYNGAHAVMQPDGNLVVYDTSNVARWASNTAGISGVSLFLDNDGNGRLMNTGWSTQGQVYNRQAAVNYANTYAINANPNSPSPGLGNDCTDFISQAISWGGGYPQQGGSSSTDDTQWWLHNGFWGYSWSNSWTLVLDNLTFFQRRWPGGSMGSLAPGGSFNSYLPGTMTIGDTISYDWGVGGGLTQGHASIVVSSYGQDSKNPGYWGALVDEHTSNRSNVIYNLGPYNVYWQTTTLYFEHIY